MTTSTLQLVKCEAKATHSLSLKSVYVLASFWVSVCVSLCVYVRVSIFLVYFFSTKKTENESNKIHGVLLFMCAIN